MVGSNKQTQRGGSGLRKDVAAEACRVVWNLAPLSHGRHGALAVVANLKREGSPLMIYANTHHCVYPSCDESSRGDDRGKTDRAVDRPRVWLLDADLERVVEFGEVCAAREGGVSIDVAPDQARDLIEAQRGWEWLVLIDEAKGAGPEQSERPAMIILESMEDVDGSVVRLHCRFAVNSPGACVRERGRRLTAQRLEELDRQLCEGDLFEALASRLSADVCQDAPCSVS